MHENSLIEMNKFKEKYLKDMKGCSILDIGSRNVKLHKGHKTYREVFENDYSYTGMDIVPGVNVDIVGFENLSGKVFDVVISGQTMEHVNMPWDWLKSLVPFYSKYICIIVPWKFPEHRFPIDTYRYLPDGMRDLFNYSGIKEVEIFKSKKDTVGIGTK